MLNDWEYALADNTSKGLFVASSKRRFVEAQKQKPSRKIYSKVLRQAIDPFVGSPCPAVVVGGGGGGGVVTVDLPLVSKVLTSPEVTNLSLRPAKNLPVLQDLPQVHQLVRSLFPEGLRCRYPLAGRLKYFRKN